MIRRALGYSRFFISAILIHGAFAAVEAKAELPEIFSSSPALPEALSDVVSILEEARTIRASFLQERQIKGLSRPLTSRGTFIYERGRGIAWVQETPFKIAYIVTPKGVRRQSMTEGLTSEAVEDNPIARQISSTLLSVWSGDLTQLEKSFTIYRSGKITSWTVGLKPKSREVSSILSSIVLFGDKVVQRVSVTDANGDLSNFSLTNVESNPALTQDEVKFFS